MAIARIRVLWTGVAGSPFYSNFYFRAINSVEAKSCADAVMNVLDGYLAQMRTGLACSIDPDVAVIDEASGDRVGGFQITPPTGFTGTGTSDPMPPMTQLLVQLKTPVYAGGRRIQGRFFFPGWTELSNDVAGRPLAALRADIATNFQVLINLAQDWVVWSRVNGVSEPITAVSCAADWSVLRSRRD